MNFTIAPAFRTFHVSTLSFTRQTTRAAAAAMVAASLGTLSAVPAAKGEIGWHSMAEIIARIVPPTFPARDFRITDFGAKSGGNADCTKAIASAIAACHDAGGGRVVVPPGEWLTGAIHLRSNVNLHVASGATLKFNPDPEQYLPVVFTRWNGTDVMNYSSLIYADGQENIAITGGGTLDGQANYETWWTWTKNKVTGTTFKKSAESQKRLFALADKGVPAAERGFGRGEFLRPNFVTLVRCRNILIEGVRIRNSPMWELHPLLSSNITVRGVDISSHGPNNDGCDPESCRDVLIEDCVFDTGDDCIAIKSGRNDDGRRARAPSENVIVRRCVMKDGHGGVVLGSECSGDIRNVFVEDCTMDSPNLDRALRFKSNAMRGGTIENIFMRRIDVGRVKREILEMNFLYDEGADGPHRPIVRNVNVENISSRSAPRVLSLVGLPDAPVGEIRLVNCTFRGVEGEDRIEHAMPVTRVNVTTERVKP